MTVETESGPNLTISWVVDGYLQTPSSGASCNVATKQIVFLSKCEDTAQNTVIQKMLEEMEISNQKINGVLVSKKAGYDTHDGAYFILADITPSQIDSMKTTTGVEAVEPDIPLDDGDFSADDGQTDRPEPIKNNDRKKKNRLKKRKTYVNSPSKAWNDLRFLSTAPGKIKLSDKYAFIFPEDRITVYVLDYGLNPKHISLDEMTTEYKYALGATQTQSDPSPISHGTCICSKILGDVYGVAKADLAFTEIAKIVSSLLDGIQWIKAMLIAKLVANKPIKGYSVVNIALQFDTSSASPYTLNEIESQIQSLMDA